MENDVKVLNITSIDELKKIAEGEIVELPEFDNGHKFVARLKRPSMLSLVQTGKIPNSLLTQANDLFVSGPNAMVSNKLDENMLKDMLDIIEIICNESFVEPTFNQIKDAGVQLTDEQYFFIFNYSQRGVKALENFR